MNSVSSVAAAGHQMHISFSDIRHSWRCTVPTCWITPSTETCLIQPDRWSTVTPMFCSASFICCGPFCQDVLWKHFTAEVHFRHVHYKARWRTATKTTRTDIKCHRLGIWTYKFWGPIPKFKIKSSIFEKRCTVVIEVLNIWCLDWGIKITNPITRTEIHSHLYVSWATCWECRREGFQASDQSSRLHFNILSMKPLDIFREAFGQLPMVFAATKTMYFM